MHDFLPFIIIGLVSGSIYGLCGIGLVLTYKTSNVFNFAYGSLGAVAAFFFYFLRQQHGLPWPVAWLISCLVLGPVMGLLLERLGRAIGPAATEIRIAATVGIVLVVLSMGTLWFPGATRQVSPYLPTGTVTIASVNVSWDQIITFVFATGATVILYLFFRVTRLGTAMRGVVDNPDLLSRTGESPARVRRFAWIIGSTLAAISGVLLAPSINLDAATLTMLVVQAFGAAAIGLFTSLPLTFAGGILIGVLASLATKYAATYQSVALSNAGTALPFLILFLVLLFTPGDKLRERAVKPIVEVTRSWRGPLPYRVTAGLMAIVALAFVPSFAGTRQAAYSNMLVQTILILSLGLLVKLSKQVSLCQITFAAVGAAAMGHLAGSFHVPWLLALVFSGLVAVPVAALVSIPAIRLSGVFLALATLGFGIFVQDIFFPLRIMFGTQTGVAVPRPGGGIGGWSFGSDKGFYYVLLCIVVFVVVLIELITSGRLGRLLRALGDSPLVLQTHGTTVAVTQLIVFCISAALAAMSGALSGSLFSFASSTQYDSFQSLFLFVSVVIVLAGSPWYALLVAAGLTLGPAYIQIHGSFATWLQLLFGITAISFVWIARKPPRIPLAIRQFLERHAGTKPSVTPALVGGSDGALRPLKLRTTESANGSSSLVVSDLTVRFGGVTAVDQLQLESPMGRITGLIGPNGAGKSTTFNACSGLVRAANGRVAFIGDDITKLAPHRRARLGIGRTFQRAELLDSLSVTENVEIGAEAVYAGANLFTQIHATRSQRNRARALSEEAIRATGLDEVRNTQVGLLPTGVRRRVEVARVLAGEFQFVLMDEPSSGLDAVETRTLGELLRRVVKERQIGVLLVEHDMSLVRQVCDYVYVLDFGEKIFEGSVADMQSSEAVRSAYLGSDYAAVSQQSE